MEPVEGVPLIQRVTTGDAAARSSPRSSSRRRAALALALVSVSALFVAARRTSSAAEAEEVRLAITDRQDGGGVSDDYTDENGLYVCKNGVPEVPNEYSNGSWGNIDGRWYAIAGNLNDNTHEGGTGNIGDCARFAFDLHGARNQSMTQNMIYYDDDTSSSNDGGGEATTATWYYWNLTDWRTDDDVTPYWKNNDDVDEMYSNFWSSVFAVGHSGGKRWFGFYLCGPPVTVTRRGQYFILYESHDYDDSLLDAARTAVDAAGLTRGNFTEYHQGSSCSYNWHHIALENGNEWV